MKSLAFFWIFGVAVCVFFCNPTSSHANQQGKDVSPFSQNLPDCTAGFERLEKKTSAKALLCPMIRYGNMLLCIFIC
jgi:hypothetical protein